MPVPAILYGMDADESLQKTSPVLFEAFEQRRRELNLHAEGVVSSKTRAKIRQGQSLDDATYVKIDRKLGWKIGSAKRAAQDGIWPELEPTDPLDRTGLMHTVGEVTLAAAGVPPAAIREADDLAQQLLLKLRLLKSKNG